MKKNKSPWYGAVWIVVWTAALVWFLYSGMFNTRESVGLVLVWLVLVGVTGYFIVQQLRQRVGQPKAQGPRVVASPALNSLCSCGSGKKFKRCCGASAQQSGRHG